MDHPLFLFGCLSYPPRLGYDGNQSGRGNSADVHQLLASLQGKEEDRATAVCRRSYFSSFGVNWPAAFCFGDVQGPVSLSLVGLVMDSWGDFREN